MKNAKVIACLSSYSPSTLRQIADFFSAKGESALAEIAEAQRESYSPIFAFLDFIEERDISDVWIGINALMLSAIRNPRFGKSDYARILTIAFSLPTGIADAMANKIESQDVLLGAQGSLTSFDTWKTKIREALRRVYNPIATTVGLDAIDASQDWDVDFLYELKNMGAVIRELNSRVRLMNAQASIAAGMGLFSTTPATAATGDPESDYQSMIGDAIAPLMGAPLMSTMKGGLSPIMNFGTVASTEKLSKVIADGGAGAASVTSRSRAKGIKGILQKIVSVNPTTAMIAAAAAGLGGGLLPTLFSRKTGDPIDSDVYGDVDAEYGDVMADAWASGDIDSIVREALTLLTDPSASSSGDPDLDGDIETAISAEMEGDSLSEAGGLFKSWRIRRLKKKAARRRRRSARRSNRQARRDRKNQAFIEAKNEADAARYTDEPADEYYEEPPAPKDGTYPVPDESGEETTNEGTLFASPGDFGPTPDE